MPDQATLRTETRTILGAKVKQLRREGILPCNVYARGQASIALQTPVLELQRVFRSVDRNAVVQMEIDGSANTLPVVLREVQRHPVTYDLLHVDFYQVDLTRLIHSEARIVLIGEAAGTALGGTLVQSLEFLPLEALPMEMPSELEVDITHLTDFGSSVLVREVALPPGVRALADEAVAVAALLAPRVLEVEEEEALAAAEQAEADALALAAGAVPEEGDEPSDD